jgi:hypothetical protein
MVAKEMLEELKNIQKDFEWTYDGQNRKIRAKLKSGSEAHVFDPIGAVCYSYTGLVFSEENWFRAAEIIGLSHIDAGDLIAAANNTCDPDEHHTHKLRREMIEGVLLQPETPDMPHGFMSYVSGLFGSGSRVSSH